ncbi:hypothetical protein C5E44_10225 [Nocardia nova]|uniref:hypothetical protein n=1 Tax=Nocardia nova TaxID=37330 RepID=UPI000CEA4D5E|nr:hypothetical protein C5E44_10225 [Nocardia nova]
MSEHDQDLTVPEDDENNAAGSHSGDDNVGASQDGSDARKDDRADNDDNPNRREARYRTERNEARAERDALSEQVTGLQRHIIAGIASEEGMKAAALFASGVDISQLLGDDGMPDADKVKAAVTRVREAFGIPRMQPTRGMGRTDDDGDWGRTSGRDAWIEAVSPRGGDF